jgi:hypothetical protein
MSSEINKGVFGVESNPVSVAPRTNASRHRNVMGAECRGTFGQMRAVKSARSGRRAAGSVRQAKNGKELSVG